VRFLDLTQDFSLHTPAFAGYPGPAIRWIKHLAFDRAGGQEITMTLHVSTHLDAPAHFMTRGKFIGDLTLNFLIGPACVVDLEKMGLGDFDVYGPEHFERWEKDTGHRIERGDILVIHTGYHRYFAEWVLERGVRWIAVDTGSADHPLNTVIRRIRADEAEDAEKKLGKSLDEIFPKADYQIMHTLLFPHDIVHIENLGGQIDDVLDQKIQLGCFPWRFQGGEAALCRAVAMVE
jgi:kynurenine formamidase